MTSSPPAGLRARKKAKTRAAIREHAMRLFAEQGYAATTVDQIAEAAEVSPSTFFRYFPTKEDVVLTDDYDPLILEAIRAQPAGVPAVRAVLQGMRDVLGGLSETEWAGERRRQRLFQTVPELRARQLQQTVAALGMLAEAIAERMGVAATDPAPRALAGALVGIVLAIVMPGTPGSPGGFQDGDFDRIERALLAVRDGLGEL